MLTVFGSLIKMHMHRRAFSSIALSIVRSAANLVATTQIARHLGANSYGELLYICYIASLFRQIVDLSSSSAIFTQLAGSKKCRLYFRCYLIWIMCQMMVMLGGSLAAAVLQKLLFVDSKVEWVKSLIVFTAVFFQHTIWVNVGNLLESIRLSIVSQIISTVASISNLVIIFGLVYGDQFNVVVYLTALMITWASASFIGIWYFIKSSGIIQDFHSELNFKSWFASIYGYCQPLIFLNIIVAIGEVIDRTILQKFAGPQEQTYYGIGVQMATIGTLAISSVIKILWKELAENVAKGNLIGFNCVLIDTTTRFLAVSCFFGFFVALNSENIVVLLFGGEYLKSHTTVSLMAIYSIIQTIGQIITTALYASSDTKVLSVNSISACIIATALSYPAIRTSCIFNFPQDFGSSGLALKNLAIHFGSIGFLVFYLEKSKGVQFPFVKYCYLAGGFFLIALLSKCTMSKIPFVKGEVFCLLAVCFMINFAVALIAWSKFNRYMRSASSNL